MPTNPFRSIQIHSVPFNAIQCHSKSIQIHSGSIQGPFRSIQGPFKGPFKAHGYYANKSIQGPFTHVARPTPKVGTTRYGTIRYANAPTHQPLTTKSECITTTNLHAVPWGAVSGGLLNTIDLHAPHEQTTKIPPGPTQLWACGPTQLWACSWHVAHML